MLPAERVYTAIDGGAPDRVPVVPKIWVDLGARLTDTPLTEVIADPLTALWVIARAGRECGVDAVRQFHFPFRRVKEEGDRVFEVDDHVEVLGEIDLAGGLGTHLLDPKHFDIRDPRFMGYHHYWSAEAPFVRDLDDAKRITVPPRSFTWSRGAGSGRDR